MRIFYLFLACMVLSFSAQAACTGPDGVGGDIIFNTDHETLQYCNNTNWVAFPKGAAGCELPWGGVLASGEDVAAFETASVPFGGTCNSQQRTCNDGALLGSFGFQTCSVNGADDCELGGQVVTHGNSFTFYSAGQHANCASISQSRQCNNGTLTGNASFQYVSCSALPSCPLPWGGTLNHGGVVTAYQTASVSGKQCASQQRTCNSGALSGTYTNQDCYGVFSGSIGSGNMCSTCALEDRNEEQNQGGGYYRYLLHNDQASLNRRCVELGYVRGQAMSTYTNAEWCSYDNARSKRWTGSSWNYVSCTSGNVKQARCYYH